MRRHNAPAALLGELDGINGLCHGADLVHLEQEGIASPHLGRLGDADRVGNGQVVADNLHILADGSGEGGPALPVVLIKTYFGVN